MRWKKYPILKKHVADQSYDRDYNLILNYISMQKWNKSDLKMIFPPSSMDRSQEITAQVLENTSSDGPGLILSPFSPDFNFASFLGSRTQCSRKGCNNVGTKKCGQCNNTKYCSRECQVADWKQNHRDICRHPTAESTFIGEVPSSWTASSTLAITTSASQTSVPLRSVSRTMYDDTHQTKIVNTPSIYSMASRPSLLAYLEHHSQSTDGSFAICVANGSGAFISKVRLRNFFFLFPLLSILILEIV